MRTKAGSKEIDLIVVRPDQKILAVEVKLSSQITDTDVKNLLWLKKKLGPDVIDCIVISTGPQAYRRRDGIAIIPAILLAA